MPRQQLANELTPEEAQAMLDAGDYIEDEAITPEQAQKMLDAGDYVEDGFIPATDEGVQLEPVGDTLQAGIKKDVEISPEEKRELDLAGVLPRSLELAKDSTIGAVSSLVDLGKQTGQAIIDDPKKAIGEAAGTIAAPILGTTARAALDLVGQQDTKLPFDLDKFILAEQAGLKDFARNIPQGVGSANADVANTLDFLLTGDTNPDVKPLFEVPEFTTEEERQAQAEHPLASAATNILPFIAAGRLAGKIPKTPRGRIKADVGTGAALGAISDPGVEDVRQRAAGRLMDASQIAGLSAASQVFDVFGKSVKANNKVNQIRKELGISKQVAGKLVKDSSDLDTDVNTLKQGFGDINRTQKGRLNLTPEETASFVDSKGKPIKEPLVIGSKKDITKALKNKGYGDAEADTIYRDFVQERKSASFYEARVQADREILRKMGKDTIEAPTRKNQQRQALIGKKQLEDTRVNIRKKAVGDIQGILGVSQSEAYGITKGLHHPLEDLGTNATLTTKEALMTKVSSLHEGRLADTTPRASKIMNQVVKQLPEYKQSIAGAREELNKIQDDLLLTLSGKDPDKVTIFGNNPISQDLMSLTVDSYQRMLKDGTLIDAMKGDYTNISPEMATKVAPIAKRLVEHNKTQIIPKIREVYGLNDIDNLDLDDFIIGLEQNKAKLNVQDVDAEANKLFNQYKKGQLSEEKLKEIGAFIDLDAAKVSNSQSGEMVHKWNLKRLRASISKDTYTKFIEEFGIGEKGNETALFGYFDSPNELFDHLKDNMQRYKKKFPFLYTKNGKVRRELILSEENAYKILSDLENTSRLDQSQINRQLQKKPELMKKLQQHTGLDGAELNKMINDFVLTGNVKKNKYRRFIGSLLRSDHRLTTENVNPFQIYNKQTVDLAKRKYLGPVINDLIDAQDEIQRMLADTKSIPGDVGTVKDVLTPGSGKFFQLGDLIERYGENVTKWKLQRERSWYKDLEGMYRNTPHEIDQNIFEFLDSTVVPPEWRKTFNVASAKRRWDKYSGVESVLKLGLNATASTMNIYEAFRSGVPELTSKQYGKILEELGVNSSATGGDAILTMSKGIQDLVEDAQKSKAAPLLFDSQDFGTGINTAFVGPNKFLGSRTGGSVKDIMMFPFQKGTNIGKLVSYKVFKTIGETEGLAGEALDDFIIKQMARHGSIQELSKIPLQQRLTLAKPFMLFKSYLVRLADLETNHLGKLMPDIHRNPEGLFGLGMSFPEASADSIQKAAMFTLAPAILMGVETSPTLLLGTRALDTITGIKNTTSGQPQELGIIDEDRAKQGELTGGLLGSNTDIDTSIFSADMASVFGIDDAVIFREAEAVQNLAKDIFGLKRIQAGENTSRDRIGSRVAEELLNQVVAGKRAKQAIDIFNIGEVRDSGDNLIQDIPEEEKFGRSIAKLAGLRDADVTSERLANKRLKLEQKGYMEDVKLMNSLIDDLAKDTIKDGDIDQERLNEIGEMFFNLTNNFDFDKRFNKTVSEHDLLAKKKIFDSLPEATQLKILRNPKTRQWVEDIIIIED